MVDCPHKSPPMRRYWFSLLLLPLFALRADAQNAPAPAAATPITLGESAVALNGPWKFHTGDSPQANGAKAPRWADPDFDDSGWQNYAIDPKHSAMTAVEAVQTPQLAGWQQHGHPGYTGYAWYRIRLQAPLDTNSLALLMPQYVDDAYDVYVNDQKIGSFGKLDGWHVLYPQQAKLFPILVTSLSSDQPTTLAIRVWNIRYEALSSQHNLNGGLRGVPLLGPYINGIEIEVPHDLPLGVVAGLQYEVRAATLPAGGTMVIMTDGVVEAQNEKKELFGFERAQQIGNQPAAVIADAAQKFGQQDDITVVSIERVLAAATSVA